MNSASNRMSQTLHSRFAECRYGFAQSLALAAPSGPNGSLPRCHALPALPALPSANELTAPSPVRVDYPKVPTSAIPAFEAALILRRVPGLSPFGALRALLFHRLGYVSFGDNVALGGGSRPAVSRRSGVPPIGLSLGPARPT